MLNGYAAINYHISYIGMTIHSSYEVVSPCTSSIREIRHAITKVTWNATPDEMTCNDRNTCTLRNKYLFTCPYTWLIKKNTVTANAAILFLPDNAKTLRLVGNLRLLDKS